MLIDKWYRISTTNNSDHLLIRKPNKFKEISVGAPHKNKETQINLCW